MSRASRYSAFLLPGIILLAFALRLYHLDFQSLWRDETDALRFATRALPELLGMFRRPGENGPLFFLGLRPWLAVAGQSEFALRFPSAMAGTLAVPLLYVLVQRLAGRWPALVSAFLMATAPYLVWYGQEAKMYAVLSASIPLSLWLTIRAAQRGGFWRWLALYVVTTLSIYTHLLAALVVPVQLFWLLVAPSEPGMPDDPGMRRRWRIAAVYTAALVLPYLPLAVWQMEMLFSSFETGHPFVPFPTVFRVLAVGFSQGVLSLQHPLMLLPALLALLAGVVLWPQDPGHARVRVLAMLLVWLLLPPLALFAISLGMPLFLDRYLIWTMPAFLALLAAGVVSLAHAWRPLAMLVLSAVLAVNLWGVSRQATQPIKSDFRSAAAYVADHRQPDDILVFHISYIRDLFSYYYGKDIGRSADGPYTNGMSDGELGELMAQRTDDAGYVWLIDSESSMWDERGLVRGWLDAHGAVTHHADFARVSVTRYDLR